MGFELSRLKIMGSEWKRYVHVLDICSVYTVTDHARR